MRWRRIIVYAAILYVLKAAWGLLAATYAVGVLSQLPMPLLAAMSYLGLVGGVITVAVLGVMAYRTPEGVWPTLLSVLLAALISSVAGVLVNALFLVEQVMAFQVVVWTLGTFLSLIYALLAFGLGFGLRVVRQDVASPSTQ